MLGEVREFSCFRPVSDRPLDKQPLHEPVGQPSAAVPNNAEPVDPVASPRAVLDAVVVAQAGVAFLTPPFGGDPLGAFDPGHLVHRAAPAELLRETVGRGVEHRDLIGRTSR